MDSGCRVVSQVLKATTPERRENRNTAGTEDWRDVGRVTLASFRRFCRWVNG